MFQPFWFLVRTLFLGCRQLPSSCVPTQHRVSKLSSISSYKDIIRLNQGPTLMTSFTLNYFLTPNIATMEVKVQLVNLGGHIHVFRNSIFLPFFLFPSFLASFILSIFPSMLPSFFNLFYC